MLRKTVTYTDYFGVEKTEEFFFHLSRPEIVELEVEVKGGYSELLKTIAASNDNREIVATFKKILLMSYGEKSPDGKQFRKSPQIVEEFTQTAAYDALFMEFLTDEKAMLEFVNGILPEAPTKTTETRTLPAPQDHLQKSVPDPEVVQVPSQKDLTAMSNEELQAEINRINNR